MRKLTTAVLTVLLINLGAQEFKYSGYIKSSNEVGLQNVPVKLMGRRISVYDIAQPTYTTAVAYNTGTAIPSSDDVVSGALPIGFTFNFFGTNYTQFYAGSNGWIGFSPGQTTGYTAAFIPNAGSPLNCILGDWEDLFPGAANIFYTTIGTAPNRRLVVSYYQVPHYGCRTNLHTFQFVLSEGTNNIQINYQSKPQCGGNNATAGLVGTSYLTVVPIGGNNAVQWTETNSSYRFNPAPVEMNYSSKGTFTTDATGKYDIQSGLDINSYQFAIQIDSLPLPSLSILDARAPLNVIWGLSSMNTIKYFLQDVNNDGRLTTTDMSIIYGIKAGRYSVWPAGLPKYRLFTPAQWSTIKISLNDLRSIYPGTQSILINSPTNNGTSDYYLIRTGFSN